MSRLESVHKIQPEKTGRRPAGKCVPEEEANRPAYEDRRWVLVDADAWAEEQLGPGVDEGVADNELSVGPGRGEVDVKAEVLREE